MQCVEKAALGSPAVMRRCRDKGRCGNFASGSLANTMARSADHRAGVEERGTVGGAARGTGADATATVAPPQPQPGNNVGCNPAGGGQRGATLQGPHWLNQVVHMVPKTMTLHAATAPPLPLPVALIQGRPPPQNLKCATPRPPFAHTPGTSSTCHMRPSASKAGPASRTMTARRRAGSWSMACDRCRRWGGHQKKCITEVDRSTEQPEVTSGGSSSK